MSTSQYSSRAKIRFLIFYSYGVIVGLSTKIWEGIKMPYKMTVTVPRITAAMIAEFEAKAPGLSGLVTIPAIEFIEDAKDAAEVLATHSLTRYEYVSKVETITETATGWIATVRIAGD